MGIASLALLKGANKTNVSDELEKQEAAPEVAEEPTETTTEDAEPEGQTHTDDTVENVAAEEGEQTISAEDVQKMSGKDIDQLLKDNEVATPEGWDKMKVADKRTWLIAQLAGEEPTAGANEEPAGDASTAAAAEPDPAPAVKEEAKAPATKTTTKTKSATANDPFASAVQEIENLKEDDARKLVGQLANEGEQTHFKLGGVLSVIQANGWFQPYASFREYVEGEHGLAYRRAAYWVQIYNDLIEAKVSFNDVKHLGWTKLTVLSAVLTTDNAAEWIKIAEKQTVLQLTETIKNHKAQQAQKNLSEGGEEKAKTVTTKTFKVHEDQKATIEAAIDKAKAAANTQVDTVALESICLEYLNGVAKPLDQVLQKAGLEGALEALQKAYPNANINVELTE